jgi:hypothetical protein
VRFEVVSFDEQLIPQHICSCSRYTKYAGYIVQFFTLIQHILEIQETVHASFFDEIASYVDTHFSPDVIIFNGKICEI